MQFVELRHGVAVDDQVDAGIEPALGHDRHAGRPRAAIEVGVAVHVVGGDEIDARFDAARMAPAMNGFGRRSMATSTSPPSSDAIASDDDASSRANCTFDRSTSAARRAMSGGAASAQTMLVTASLRERSTSAARPCRPSPPSHGNPHPGRSSCGPCLPTGARNQAVVAIVADPAIEIRLVVRYRVSRGLARNVCHKRVWRDVNSISCPRISTCRIPVGTSSRSPSATTMLATLPTSSVP